MKYDRVDKSSCKKQGCYVRNQFKTVAVPVSFPWASIREGGGSKNPTISSGGTQCTVVPQILKKVVNFRNSPIKRIKVSHSAKREKFTNFLTEVVVRIIQLTTTTMKRKGSSEMSETHVTIVTMTKKLCPNYGQIRSRCILSVY